MRFFSSLLLAGLLITQSIGTAFASFNDIEGSPYAETIQYLEGKGVIQGFENSEFKPEDRITRVAFLKMLLANFDFDPTSITQFTHPYADIENDSWYGPYVQRAWELGLTPNDGTLNPGESIRRVEAIQYVLSLLGLPAPRLIEEEEWTLDFKDINAESRYAGTVLYGMQYGIVNALEPEDGYFRPYRGLTRGEATEMMFNTDMMLLGMQNNSQGAEIETEVFGTELTYGIPNLDIFIDVWNRIHEEYYWSDEINDEALIYNALQGLVEGLGDEYSVFFDPPESETFTNFLDGDIVGVGIYIIDTDEGAVIQSFIAEAPAEDSGLRVNDLIVEVDGTDMRGKSTDEVSALIKGEAGTEVTITVEREGVEGTLSFTMMREVINISYLSGEVMGDAIYIDINLFDTLSFINFTETANALIEENPDFKGFIIDVRDNPGGYLSSVHSVLGHFIPNGSTMFYAVQAENQSSMYLSTGSGEWRDYPIVILMNENSASASELLAITLQEKNNAALVGKNTFGKGTIQQITYYEDGSSFKLTIAEWRSPEFHSINGIGIIPHYDVDLTMEDIENGEDPQLEKALEVFENEVEKWEEAQAEAVE